MKYSKKMLRAMAKTISNYTYAIDRLVAREGEVWEIAEEWRNYGSTTNCRLCQAAGHTDLGTVNCYACLLCDYDPENEDIYNCCDEPQDPARFGTMSRLENALDEARCAPEEPADRGRLLRALRVRLRWLLKRIDQNGYEVSDD